MSFAFYEGALDCWWSVYNVWQSCPVCYNIVRWHFAVSEKPRWPVLCFNI